MIFQLKESNFFTKNLGKNSVSAPLQHLSICDIYHIIYNKNYKVNDNFLHKNYYICDIDHILDKNFFPTLEYKKC